LDLRNENASTKSYSLKDIPDDSDIATVSCQAYGEVAKNYRARERSREGPTTIGDYEDVY